MKDVTIYSRYRATFFAPFGFLFSQKAFCRSYLLAQERENKSLNSFMLVYEILYQNALFSVLIYCKEILKQLVSNYSLKITLLIR